MDAIVSFLKTLYYRNKMIFLIALLVALMLFVTACNAQATQAPPPPPGGYQGAIGGAC